MSGDASMGAEVEAGLSIVLPPHLTANFEKAEARISELYGLSPGTVALVRLWLACATSSQIRREFEMAALDIGKRTLEPNSEGNFDDYL